MKMARNLLMQAKDAAADSSATSFTARVLVLTLAFIKGSAWQDSNGRWCSFDVKFNVCACV